jgi:hypothetical protein
MSDLLLRTPRATPLEYEDVDANFENLNADKLQRTSTAGVTGTITTSASTSTITGLSSNNLAVGMVVVKTAGTGVLGTASTITAVDQFNDTITVVGSTSHTLGSITFTASPALNNAYINALSIGATTPGTGAFTTLSASGNASVTGNLTIDTNTLFVDATNNRVGIGTASPASKLHLYDATFNEILVQGDATTSIIAARYSTDASNPAIALRKSRGTTASPTAVASSDTLGQLIFQGYGGTNTRNLASIQGTVGTYTSDTNISSILTFATSTSGAAAATEKMRLTAAGDLGIGNTPSGTYKLEVTGRGFFSDNLTANTDLTVNGNTTLGNASGDTLTFNASTVSTPNGLNFDSNTLVIDATNNRIGIGKASPAVALDVAGPVYLGSSDTTNYIGFYGVSGDGPATYDHTWIGERLYGAADTGELLLFKGNETADRIRMFAGTFQVDTFTTATSGTFATVGASANALKRFEIENTGYAFGYPSAGAKGIMPAYQYFRLNSNLAGGNDTTTRAIFGVGCTLVANTVYEFEIAVNFRKSAGTVTHAFRLAFGGTMGVTNILYNVWAGTIQTTLNSVDTTAPTASVDTVNITTVTDNVGTATVASVQLLVKGTISVSTAGTFIPQYALTAAPGAAYSTITGSYVKVTPLGASGANINIGSWA